MNWKLAFDGREIDCTTISRPYLTIPEEQQSDGTWKISGESHWLPLKIQVDKFLWDGCKDVELVLYENNKVLEFWLLRDAYFNEADSTLIFSGVSYSSLV